MTKALSRVFLLLIFLVLYATLCDATSELLEGPEEGPNEDIASYILRHHQTLEVPHFTEEMFRLPRNHLLPFEFYAQEQEAFVRRHIRNPSSTFAELKAEDNTHTIFATPYRGRRLLFLIVQHSNGLVTPVGFSRVPFTIPPGQDRGFWETLRAAASISQEGMMTRFPNLHL
ncbi:uncharacterized protein UTRI_06200 [Ustilago trichophora]|uniref:Uncharacterized protein n=1 Tax=Ustilago trichophora TaxID=86804 RepID=A0A5C3EIC0_9BASI|nr:uncharacterized protein UTRI_06200 [Ustilago trichophora]